MRWIFGLFSIFIAAVIGFMYKTKQLETLKIPGLPEKKLSDLHPQKIIETYKNTVSDVEQRNQALLKGELPEEKLKAAVKSANGTVAAAARVAEDFPTGETPTRKIIDKSRAAVMAASPSAPRPTKIQKYGMNLEKLSEVEVEPYLGKWFAQGGQAASLFVQLNFQPERAISSVSVTAAPSTNASFGDNSTMIWKNTQSGQVIVVINENAYIELRGTLPKIFGTFYQRHRNEVRFQKLFEFPLLRR